MTVNLRKPKPAAIRDLTVCPGCNRDMVQPVAWTEATTTHWHVWLQCASCGRPERGTFDQATVDTRLDALLDLMHQRAMEFDIERFARALRLGLLLPEDF